MLETPVLVTVIKRQKYTLLNAFRAVTNDHSSSDEWEQEYLADNLFDLAKQIALKHFFLFAELPGNVFELTVTEYLEYESRLLKSKIVTTFSRDSPQMKDLMTAYRSEEIRDLAKQKFDEYKENKRITLEQDRLKHEAIKDTIEKATYLKLKAKYEGNE